jgi:hypothetical protein
MGLEIQQMKYLHLYKDSLDRICMDVPQVCGGWSYSQPEIDELCKYIQYTDSMNILEIGLGASTIELVTYFKRKCKHVDYDGYESDPTYIYKIQDLINVYLYDENNIDDVKFEENKVYDLIFIDGPTGECRSKWYSKLKKNVKNGTILLIDDYTHYKSFQEQLDANYEYETLSSNLTEFSPGGEHSWKIVKVISAKFDN